MSVSQDIFAKRAAITSALLTKKIDAGILYADEYRTPFDYTPTTDNFPVGSSFPWKLTIKTRARM